MGSTLIRVDKELEDELRKIRERINKVLGQDVNISSTQSSKIAAKIIRDQNTSINAHIIMHKKGRVGLII